MSDLGHVPVGTPEPPHKDIPLWVVWSAVVVALVLAVFLGYGVVQLMSAPKPPPPSAGHFPAHWDKRIAPYARIAAKERDLDYQHPVAVRFLAPKAFEASLHRESSRQDRHERKHLAHETALLRAVGLLRGNPDLVKAMRSFGDSAVLAYYSFRTQSITVRGTTITPSMRSTLVHELTHVLQDQNFDVGARLKALQKQKSDDAAAEVLDAVVEGDAERVEGLYRESLSPAAQKGLDAARAAETRRARSQVASLPKIVVTLASSPYALGQGLATTAADHGGSAAVDDLLRTTPTHESVLLDPFRVLSGATSARHVRVPAVRAGEKRFESGELGAVTWYLVLAAHLPTQQSLTAADGWGGDSYVAFTRGSDTCARMAFAGRKPADTGLMTSTLRSWASRAPGNRATVTTSPGQVVLESCDPGTTATMNDDSEQAVRLVATRTALGDQLLKTGLGWPQARCLAGHLVQEYSLAQLSDPHFGAGDPAVAARVQQLAAGCQ